MPTDDLAEPSMLANKSALIKLQASRLSFVAKTKIAEVKSPRLARTPPRSAVRLHGAISIPPASRSGVKIATRVDDPIEAVNRKLDSELVVMVVRAAASMSELAAEQ